MTRIVLALLFSLLLAAPLAAKDRKGKAPPVDPEIMEKVDPLIEQLGDRSFTTREAATMALRALGLVARPAVEIYADHPSLEVRRRVARVLLHYREIERIANMGVDTSDDWPMLKRSPGRDAAAGSVAVRQVPEVLWTTELPGVIGLPYFDSPILASGDLIVVSNRKGGIAAVNRHTGEIVWLRDTGEPVNAAPVIAAGTLYIPGNSLTAMDLETGRLRWRWKTDYGVSAAPLAHDGKIFAVEKGEKLVALDPLDGSLLWRARVPATASSPVVVGDLVVIGLTTGVHAYRIANGSRKWRFETEAPVSTSAVVLPDRVIVSDDARTLYALTPDRGKRLWRRRIPEGMVRESPVVYGDAVLFSTSGATFRAIRARDGEDLWARFVGNYIQSSPCVAGGLVYFTAGSTFRAMECADGDDLWALPLEGAFTSPILVDGTLYVVTVNGVLLALK
jgi:outer membrane protein assembly factor BamB